MFLEKFSNLNTRVTVICSGRWRVDCDIVLLVRVKERGPMPIVFEVSGALCCAAHKVPAGLFTAYHFLLILHADESFSVGI